MRRAVLLLAFLPLPALAQEATPPDLVGTWTGTFRAVIVGGSPYRADEKQGPRFDDTAIPFTIEIAEQQDARFAGTVSAGTHTETMIGSLMPPDFTTGTFVDDDGRSTISIRDAETIDVCYAHNHPDSRVVGCDTVTRQ